MLSYVMSDVYFLNATNVTPGLVAWTTWYTGTCTGAHTCTMTVGGRGGRTCTAGTINMVPTGMGDECATAVVAQW